MERYSTLYGAHTFVNADGKEVNQYVEVGRSAGLDEFLKGKKIPNPAMAVADVNSTLTGFVKLPGYDDQPAYFRPMLVRYAPMHLKRLKTYDSSVVSFNAIACSAPDHQAGNRDGKYRNTHFIDRSLLLKPGEYNHLDQIFGTHLVTWIENRDVRISPIDYDAAPQKVQLPQGGADTMLIQIAAAALINKASVVLKLERGSIFQLRSMELLKQIYSLFAPIQAAEIGFSSYEDPGRITDLIATTSIRLFVVPAEADLGTLERQSGLLILDLNQGIAKPKANDLLRAVSAWYTTPWSERVSTMAALFADLYDPNDAQSYVERTRKYKEASAAMEKKLADSRGKIGSLEELKKLFDSFGSEMMSIPCQYEKFCRIAPRLMKLPQEGEEKTKPNRDQRSQWIKAQLTNLGADAVMDKGENTQQTDKERLYRFCCDVFRVDLSLEMSNEVRFRSEKVTTDYVTKQKDAEFAGERAVIAAERANFQTEKEAAVNAEKVKTESVKKQAEEQFTKLKEEKEAAVNAEKAKIEAVKQQANDHFAKLRNEKEAAVNAERAETQKVRSLMEQQNAAFAAQLKAAVDAEKIETRRVREEAEAAINAEKAKNHKIQGQLSEERSARRDSEAALVEKYQKELEAKNKEIERIFANKFPVGTLFGTKYPLIAKPVMMRLAAIALVGGLLLGMLSGCLIGGCVAGPDPTEPIPSETVSPTTVPPTTVPPTTVPPTTVPPTTVPPTTVPPSTAPRTILKEDGQIDWDYVFEQMPDIRELANEAVDIEELLAERFLTAEGMTKDLEAVLAFSDPYEEQAVFLTVVRSQDPLTQDNTPAEENNREEAYGMSSTKSDEETVTVSTALSELTPSMILDNGIYSIEVFYSLDDTVRSKRNAAISVAQQLFREITADDAEVTITTVVDKKIAVDLHGLMSEVSGSDLWWKVEYKLELRENKLAEKQQILGTGRTPVVEITFEDGSEAVIFNYADATGKRNAMVGVLGKKGYEGAFNETQVIGLKPAEQEEFGEASETSAESLDKGETA